MNTSSAKAASLPPVLRTAAMWGTYVLASRDLSNGQSLLLGENSESLANPPEGSGAAEVPIRGVATGWELDPRGATGGVVYLRGRAEDARALGESGAPIPIVPGDHGLLQYGAFSVFFQFSETIAPPRGRLRLDPSLLLAFLFSVITLCGGLFLLSLVYPDQPLAEPLELSSPEEIKERFKVYTPPAPKAPAAKFEGGNPSKPKSKDSAGGSRKSKAKPRKSRAPKSASPRPNRGPTKGLSAVTDAMQGAVGREILQTLGSISSVADALGGLKANSLVSAGGSSTGSLRGGSSAGGGKGNARVAGAGTLNTGVSGGLGNGSGKGRGSGRGRGKGAGGGKGGNVGGERNLKGAKGALPGQGLGRAQISRVVRKRKGAFQACYESALARNPGLKGGVTINFSVSSLGKVQSARIANSSLKNKRVEGCVLRMFRRLRFPRADKGTKVNWPLVFKGKG